MSPYIYAVFTAVVCVSSYVEAGCQPGWISGVASCYHFSKESETFIDAEMMCKIMGGHLAEIEDAVESAFIESHLRSINATDDYWIGLTDVERENYWVWFTSGEEATYTHWAFGQPNNHHGTENCVHIRESGTWNDVDCNDHDHYLCERNAS